MRIVALSLPFFVSINAPAAAFAPPQMPVAVPRAVGLRMGYLDDLSRDLYKEVDEPDLEKTYEATTAKETDRYGVGDWKDFVDFEEFDGGDGQMGVAGDGKKGLEKVRVGLVQTARFKLDLPICMYSHQLCTARNGKEPRTSQNREA
jgi:hypothetical protein